MVKHVVPAPVDEFFAPASKVSCAAPAPVAEHVAPEAVETYAALTPAMDSCTHSIQPVGRARNRWHYHTVLRNLRSYPLMQVKARTVSPLGVLGIWLSKYYIFLPTIPEHGQTRRIHKVALNWLFDRINLDPKIQIKHDDTRNQIGRHIDQRHFHS